MAGFELSHLLRDFEGSRINGSVNVRCRRGRFQGDMARAVQNDLCEVSVAMLLDIEDDMRLDDLGIVQVELVYLVHYVLPNRLCDGEMPAVHSNRNINICCLHGRLSVSVGTNPSGTGLCPLFVWGF